MWAQFLCRFCSVCRDFFVFVLFASSLNHPNHAADDHDGGIVSEDEEEDHPDVKEKSNGNMFPSTVFVSLDSFLKKWVVH